MKSSEMEKFLALAWIIFSQGRWISTSASKSSIRRFVIPEKAPTMVESGYYRFHI